MRAGGGSAVAAALGVAGVASAQAVFVGLGGPGGLPRALAGNVSADGRVVCGRYEHPGGAEAGFLWTQEGGFRPMGSVFAAAATYAAAITGDGTIVAGYTAGSPGPNRAFRWTLGTGASEFLPLPGDEGASATCVSLNGSCFAGNSYLSSRGDRAVRWTGPGLPEDLGGLPGHYQIHVSCMSGDGRAIMGWSQGPEGVLPFRWTGESGIEVLPLQLPPGSHQSLIAGTNVDGSVIVGEAIDATGASRACVWTAAGAVSELGLLPGTNKSWADRVSGDGEVVIGSCAVAYTAEKAFIWRRGTGMLEMGDYLRGFGLDLSGWELTSAYAISTDGGTIAGSGRHDGVYEGWVAIVPVCRANCDGSTAAPVLNVADFVCFMNRYAEGSAWANCDGSTGTPSLSVNDFVCFQMRFAEGCP